MLKPVFGNICIFVALDIQFFNCFFGNRTKLLNKSHEKHIIKVRKEV